MSRKKRPGDPELASKDELVGTAPYGYRVGPDGVRLEPCPAESLVVEQILELHRAGASIRRIAETLQLIGVVSRRGKPLGLASIHAVVVSRTAFVPDEPPSAGPDEPSAT